MKWYMLLATSLIFFSACNSQNATTNSENATTLDGVLDVDQFAKILQQTASAQLIDVRTANEFQTGHLANAQNWDFLSGQFQDQIKQLNKDQPVFLYCQRGGRSHKCYQLLKENGFSQVLDLKGGFLAWQNKNMPVRQ